MLISKPPSYVIFFLASALTPAICHNDSQTVAGKCRRQIWNVHRRRPRIVGMTWHGMASILVKCNPITSHPLYPCRAALTGMFPIPMSDVADMGLLACLADRTAR